MTLDQLRVFVAVAERQHVTRAAEALNIAQSTASAAVAALEGRHGAKLFHRVGRGTELTEAGTLFLREARAVLARAEMAELVLSELGGLKRGTLSVRASQTIASHWLPRHLVAFRRAHPGVEVRLGIGNTAEVARAVHEGESELGFVEGAVDDPALEGVRRRTRPHGAGGRARAPVGRPEGPGAHHKTWATCGVMAGGSRTANEPSFVSSGSASGIGWNPGHRRRKASSSSPLSTRVRTCRAK